MYSAALHRKSRYNGLLPGSGNCGPEIWRASRLVMMSSRFWSASRMPSYHWPSPYTDPIRELPAVHEVIASVLAWVPRNTDALTLYLRLEVDLGKQEKEKQGWDRKEERAGSKGNFQRVVQQLPYLRSHCMSAGREQSLSAASWAYIFHQSESFSWNLPPLSFLVHVPRLL